MNRNYKVIWNRALGCFTAVAEYAKSRGKSSSGSISSRSGASAAIDSGAKLLRLTAICAGIAASGFSIQAVADFSIQANTQAAEFIGDGETVTFQDGNSNIKITRSGNTISIATSQDPNFATVTTTGNANVGGTLNANGGLTVAGNKTVSMGNNQVTNVADGTATKDAVNFGQLDAVKTTATNANQGWNIQANNGTTQTIAPGATVNFTNGANIAITRNGNTISIATSLNPSFSTVTTTGNLVVGGNQTVAGTSSITGTQTIGGMLSANGGLTVASNKTVSMGGNTVTNVGDGDITETSTDAINGGNLYNQLFTTSDGIRYFHANSTKADSQAIGDDSIAIGPTSIASGIGSFAAGFGATTSATADNSIALGSSASADLDSGTAIGNQAQSKAENAIAIGKQTLAIGKNSTSIGATGDPITTLSLTDNNTDLTAINGISVTATGTPLSTDGTYNPTAVSKITEIAGVAVDDAGVNQFITALKAGANFASGDNSLSLGVGTIAAGNSSVAIGDRASAAVDAVSIGRNTVATGSAVGIGPGATAAGANSFAGGKNAQVTAAGSNAVAIGNNSQAGRGEALNPGTSQTLDPSGKSAVAIGNGAQAQMDYDVAMGKGAGAGSFGLPSADISNVYIGEEAGSGVFGGGRNVAVGARAGKDRADDSDENVAIGNEAGLERGGSFNIALGNQAGSSSSIGATGALSTDDSISIGRSSNASANGALAMGANAAASGENSLALGINASTKGSGSIALGGGSTADIAINVPSATAYLTGQTASSIFSIGSENTGTFRRIINVAGGVKNTDAANVGQLKELGTEVQGLFGDDVTVNPDGSLSFSRDGENTLSAYLTKNGLPTGGIPGSSEPNAVVYDGPSQESITLANTQIRRVADGISDTDAVNVRQLKEAGPHFISVNTTENDTNYTNNGASGTDAIAIGPTQGAIGDYSLAIGRLSVAEGNDSLAIGRQSRSLSESATAIGLKAQADAKQSIAIGQDSRVESQAGNPEANSGIAIGYGARVTREHGTSIGQNALSESAQGQAFGYQSYVHQNSKNSNAIGNLAEVEEGSESANAIGNNAKVNKNAQSANAFGDRATVNAGATSSTAIGTGATTSASNAYALGTNAQSSGTNAYAQGSQAKAFATDAYAIGNSTESSANRAYAIGSGARATQATPVSGKDAFAIGTQASVNEDSAYAIGKNATSTADSGYAIGNTAASRKANSFAIGSNANTNGINAYALGNTASATDESAVAIGTSAAASKQDTTAIGSNAAASAQDAIAFGRGSIASEQGAIAFGQGAKATANANDVALGTGSRTDAVVNTANATIDKNTYIYAGTNASSTVSVGTATNKRTVTNVAAGRVSVDSTDAINGSQLFGTNQAVNALANNLDTAGQSVANSLGGTSAYNATTHQVTAGLRANGNTYTTVESAVQYAAQGWGVKVNTSAADTVLPGETVQFVDGKNIKVTRDSDQVIKVSTGDEVEFTKVTLGSAVLNNAGLTLGTGNPSITTSGINAGNKVISGVLAGVNATDGVNVSQLNATNAATRTIVAAGTNVASVTEATNTTTGQKTYTVNANGAKTVAGSAALTVAETALAGNVTQASVDLSAATKASLVKADNAVLYDTAAKDRVTLGNAGTPVTITNVAAGALNTTSKDAVNGSQLNATNDNVTTNAGNITTLQGGFTLQSNGANGAAIKAGDTVDIGTATGETNITVSKIDNVVDFALNKNLDLSNTGSVTVGNSLLNTNGLTIAGGPSITTAGINAGGKQITGVASGIGSDTNAANIGDLNNAVTGVTNAGLNFKGDRGTAINRKLGDTLNITGGAATGAALTTGNIGIRNDGSEGLIVELAQKLDLGTDGSVKTGNSLLNNIGLTIAGGPSVTTAGINAGNQVITGVANGSVAANSKEAINGGQLSSAAAAAKTEVAAGTNVVNAVKTTGTNGQDIYTINAKGASTTAGSGAVTVINTTDSATNVTNAAVDLSDASKASLVKADNAVLYDTATKDRVTLGNAGTPVTITNVAAGALNTTSKDAVNGSQLNATNDNVTTNAGNITTLQGGFTLQSNGANGAAIKAGDTVDIGTATGETNLTVAKNGNVVDFALNPVLTGLTSVTAGNSVLNTNGLTLGTGNPSITTSGINAGNKVITGVLAGVNDTDAVNVNQLSAANTVNAAARTAVAAGTNVASVTEATNTTTGQKTYTVNANGAKTVAGSAALTVAETALAGNVTQASVDLSAATKASLVKADNAVLYDTAAKDRVTLGNAGTPVTITNVAAGALNTTSKDAVNGSQLNATNDNVTTNAGNITTLQGGFTLQSNGANGAAIKAGDTVDIGTATGETNLTVAKNGNVVDFALNPVLTGLTSVTAGNSVLNTNGLTLGTGNPSITTSGINAGNKVISGVLAGVNATDGVNVSQLNATNAATRTIVAAGTNVASVTEATNTTTGQKTYTVNANGAKTVAGSAALTVAETALAGNVTQASVDLSAATKASLVKADNAVLYDTAAKDRVTLGNAGTPVTITNVAAGTTPTDAVNFGQLTTTNNNVTTNAGNITTLQGGFTLQSNGANGAAIKAGDTVDIGTATGETNITVSKIDNVVDFALNKNLDLSNTGSVTVGNSLLNTNGLTIAGGPSITTAGINAGGKQITGVASGIGSDTNAANIGDLNNAVTGVTNAGLNFKGDRGTAINRKLGDTLNITGGAATGAALTTGNIGIRNDGSEGLIVELAQKLDLGTDGSVKTGNSLLNNIGLTIAGGPSVTTAGINAGNQVITGVANGSVAANSKEAINGGQLSSAAAAAKTEVAAGTNVVNAVKTTGTNGQDIYTINAKGASTTAGSGAVTVINTTDSATNVTNAAVDLSDASKASLVKADNAVLYDTATKDRVTLGNAGTPVTITNVAAGALNTTSKDAVNGSQLNATNDNVTTNAGNITTLQGGFTLQSNGANGAAIKAGDTVDIGTATGETNLTVAKNGNVVDFALNPVLTGLTSVTAGNSVLNTNGLTLGTGNPSITTSGINAGNKVISGVLAGVNATDGVNVSQLNATNAATRTIVAAGTNVASVTEATNTTTGQKTYTVNANGAKTVAGSAALTVAETALAGNVTQASVDLSAATKASLVKADNAVLYDTAAKDRVTLGNAGTPVTITNVAAGALNTTSKDAVNGSQLNATNDNVTTNAGNITTLQGGFTLQSNGANGAAIKAGDTVDIGTATGETNLTVAKNGNVVDFALNPVLTGLTSVTAGNSVLNTNGLTLGTGNPSITTSGINAGNKVITGVLAGVNDTDAVNVNQLSAANTANAAARTAVAAGTNVASVTEATNTTTGQKTYTVNANGAKTVAGSAALTVAETALAGNVTQASVDLSAATKASLVKADNAVLYDTATKDRVTLGNAGTPVTITNVAAGALNTTSKDAVNGSQLNATNDNVTTNAGNITTLQGGFTLQSNGANGAAIKAGDTVDIGTATGETNLTVAKNGNVVDFALNPVLTGLTSVTAGNSVLNTNGLTLGTGNPSITTSGINAGNKVISGVLAGVNATDGVNVSQLNATNAATRTIVAAGTNVASVTEATNTTTGQKTYTVNANGAKTVAGSAALTVAETALAGNVTQASVDLSAATKASLVKADNAVLYDTAAKDRVTLGNAGTPVTITNVAAGALNTTSKDAVNGSQLNATNDNVTTNAGNITTLQGGFTLQSNGANGAAIKAGDTVDIGTATGETNLTVAKNGNVVDFALNPVLTGLTSVTAGNSVLNTNGLTLGTGNPSITTSGINAGNKVITGVLAGVNDTDAVNVNQLSAANTANAAARTAVAAGTNVASVTEATNTTTGQKTYTVNANGAKTVAGSAALTVAETALAGNVTQASVDLSAATKASLVKADNAVLYDTAAKDRVTLGNAGTPVTITNVAAGALNTTSKDAVNGSQLNATNDNVTTNAGNITTLQGGFTLQSNGANGAAIKAGDTVDIGTATGETNLTVAKNGNVVDFALNPVLTGLTSVTAGNSVLNTNGLTLGTGNPSITTSGINAGNKVISGVLAGVNATDGVNVSQLNATNAATRTIVAAGTNVASVTEATNTTTGQKTYTVNANGAKTVAGSAALTVAETALAGNVTQASVDLSAATKASLVKADNAVLYDTAAKDRVTLGNAGTPVTITNVAAGALNTTSKDAVNGSQLNATNDNVTTNAGNITTLQGGFTLQSNGANGAAIKAGDTVDIGTATGETNITVSKIDNVVDFALNKNLDLSNTGSVTVGNSLLNTNGLTIAGGPSITTAGINAGGKQITGVASGIGSDTNAANIGDLNNAVTGVTNAGLNFKGDRGTAINRKLGDTLNITGGAATGAALTTGNIGIRNDGSEGLIVELAQKLDLGTDGSVKTGNSLLNNIGLTIAGGPSVTTAGINAGNQVITGVANGSVAANSKEAINGGQLSSAAAAAKTEVAAGTNVVNAVKTTGTNGQDIYTINAKGASTTAGSGAVTVINTTDSATNVTNAAVDLSDASKASLVKADNAVLYDTATKDRVTLGNAGTPVTITNVAAGALNTTSKDAVNGSQLNATNDNVTTNAGNITTLQGGFTLQSNGANGAAIKAGDTVDIGTATGETNLTVAKNGNVVDFALNPVLTGLTSVTAGNSVLNTNGLTLGTGNPSITTSGINAGNKVITGVLAGVNDTDAVNVNQLSAANTANAAARTAVAAGTNVASVTEATNTTTGQKTYTVNANGAKTVAGSAALTVAETALAGNVTQASVDLSAATKASLVKADNAVLYDTAAKDRVTLGNAGTPVTITNVAAGTTPTDAVNFGQLTTTNNNVTTNAGNITTLQGGFTLQSNGANGAAIKAGDTVDIGTATGETNITVSKIDNVVDFALNKNLDLSNTGSVTVGNSLLNTNGLTIAGGPSITTAGINAGGKQITGVASGIGSDTNAANIGDLNNAVTGVTNAGLNFKGDRGTAINRKLGDTLNITGGAATGAALTTGNIGIRNDGSEGLIVELAQKLDLGTDGSVKTGNSLLNNIGLTIAGGPSVTTAGINAGNQVITGVANGSVAANSKEAINGGQLSSAAAAAKTEVAAGTNVVNAVKTTGTNGQDIYTINAKGASTTAGSGAVTVINTTDSATNVTNAAVDLSDASKASLVKADNAVLYDTATKDRVTLGNAGTPVTITNVAAGALNTTSKDAVNGSQLNATNDNVTTNAGNITTLQGGFTLQSNGANGAAIKAGDTVDIGTATGETNLTVAKNGNVVDFALNPVLTGLTSVTAGNSVLNTNGLTLGTGNPSITTSGINAGNKVISGVLAGVNATDGVNVSQLNATNAATRTIVAAGTNVASVTEATNTTTGQKTYTVNANGAKTVAGSAALTVAETALAGNVTQASVDLSAATKASLVKADNAVLYDTAAKDRVTLGNAGTPVTITNVAAGALNTTSKDAVNGSQLNATNDNVTTNAGNITTLQGGFTLQSNGANGAAIKAGDTVDIGTATGETNITVSKIDNVVDFALNKNLDLSNTGSVTVGNSLLNTNGLTIAGGPSITTAGINAGGKQITGVASGIGSDTNAANIGDLNNAVTGVTNAGLNFKGDRGTAINRKLGDTLNITGGAATGAALTTGNIGIRNDGSEGLIVELAQKLDLGTDGSVKTGNSLLNNIGLTIAGGPSVTTAGINAGNQVITGVANGSVAANSKEAINGGQLSSAAAAAKTEVAAGTNVVNAVKTTGTNGQDIYTINAKGASTTAGSGAVTVINTTDSATNVTNAAVDLSDASKASLVKADNAVLYDTATKDRVTLGNAGTPVTITNVAAGALNTTSKDAVNGSQLNATNDNVTTNAGNITTLQGGFTLQSNGANGAAIKAGDTVDIGTATGETNLTVAKNGNVVDFALNPVLTGLTSVTAGNSVLNTNGLTLGTGNPSITTSGINAGNKVITGVLAGVNDTDAVNVNQLSAANTANAAARTAVAAGTNVASVTEATNTTTGQKTYTVNANGAKTVAGSAALTVAETALAGNVTQASVDLSAATKASLVKADNAVLYDTAAKDRVTLGNAGTPVTITNVAAGTTPTDAVNFGQLTTTNNNVTTNAGNITTLQGGFTLQSNGANGAAIKAGDTVDIGTATGETNITVSKIDNVVDFALNKNLDLSNTGSVTVGNSLLNTNGLTIAGGPSITTAGINAGGKQITGVASGIGSDTNAANIGDLNNAVTGVTNAGLNFKGDRGTAINRKLGDTLNITGGAATGAALTTGNIGIRNDGSEGLIVELAQKLDLGTDGSVKTGNSLLNNIGLTIAGGPSVTTAGINAGNQVITGVANGSVAANSKEAINGGQLSSAAAAAKTEVAAGTNVVNAVKTTGTNGQDIYTINAKGASTTAGSGAVTVINTTDSATNVTNAAVDLSDASKASLVKADNAVLYDTATKDRVTLGNAGTPVTITNVAAGALNTTSKDAVNGSQLNATNDNVTTNAGNITTLQGGFTLQSNGANGAAIKAGDTVDIGTATGETNLTVAKNGNVVDFALNPVLTGLTSVTAGNSVLNTNGLTLGTGNPSITTSGINAGNKVISGVLAGVNATDGVNVSQLNATNAATRTIVAAGTNVASVTEATNTTTGQKTYTVNADATTVSSTTPSAITVTPGTKSTANVTDFAVDLSAATKASLVKADNAVLYDTAAKDRVTLGNAGTPVTITNVAAGTTPTDAVNFGQLTTTNNNVTTNAGNITTLQGGFTLQSNGANGAAIKAGDTVDIGTATGETNITVSKIDNVVDFALNKNLDLSNTGSVTVGNSLLNTNGLTIAGGPSITTAGINAGGKQITGVASGIGSDTNAANIGDLNNAVTGVTNAGLNFKGDRGTAINRKLGDTLNITGGAATGAALTTGNIGIRNDGSEGLIVELAQKLDLGTDGSVKTGNSLLNNIGLTIAGGPSVTTAGINAGNQVITGVANGSVAANSKEAINGGQLFNQGTGVNTIIGGDTIYDPTTGTFTNKNIGNTGKNNINDAIQSVGQAATAAKTTVTQGKNITVTKTTDLTTGADNYEVTTAKDLVVDSVTTGNTVTNNNGVKVNDGAGNSSTMTTAGTTVTNAAGNSANYGANGIVAGNNNDRKSTIVNQDGISFTDANGDATGPTITTGGINAGNTVITNIAKGTVANNSKDAVNGGQLNATAGSITNVIGGNATNVGGIVTTTDIGGTGKDTIDDAIKAINTKAAQAKSTVTEGDNILVTKSTNADGSTDYKVATSKDLNVDSVTAGDNVLNGDGLTVGDTTVKKDGLTITGGDKGDVTLGNAGLNNGGNVITGVGAGKNDTDAVNVGQLNNVVAGANKGFNVTVQGDNSSNVANGGTVDFNNQDGNIKVTKPANGNEISFDLNGDIKVDSVTTGNTVVNNDGVTIKDGPSITATNGINAGGKVVTGVADGIAPTDAVNVGQLTTLGNNLGGAINDLGNRIGEVEDDANAGTSAAMAMSSIPQAFLPGRSMIGGGIATYNGQSAVAVGLSKVSDNGRWVMKLNGTADTQGNAGGSVGAGFHF
ncbi:ESPR-type extended signal peptide-containing protein [Psychrobacter sp. M13]|uniref:ESPR-type extended signal peptide-containing protein n=1 Tax=Psychrobacter sp. M13 TaxID=3067275 RepID=UPI00273C0B5A|nr:YadA-like family protein [Psychrobacter sp. M13]WLP95306.1 YadA-like family protein [Psychrobacter sp. M13]